MKKIVHMRWKESVGGAKSSEQRNDRLPYPKDSHQKEDNCTKISRPDGRMEPGTERVAAASANRRKRTLMKRNSKQKSEHKHDRHCVSSSSESENYEKVLQRPPTTYCDLISEAFREKNKAVLSISELAIWITERHAYFRSVKSLKQCLHQALNNSWKFVKTHPGHWRYHNKICPAAKDTVEARGGEKRADNDVKKAKSRYPVREKGRKRPNFFSVEWKQNTKSPRKISTTGSALRDKPSINEGQWTNENALCVRSISELGRLTSPIIPSSSSIAHTPMEKGEVTKWDSVVKKNSEHENLAGASKMNFKTNSLTNMERESQRRLKKKNQKVMEKALRKVMMDNCQSQTRNFMPNMTNELQGFLHSSRCSPERELEVSYIQPHQNYIYSLETSSPCDFNTTGYVQAGTPNAAQRSNESMKSCQPNPFPTRDSHSRQHNHVRFGRRMYPRFTSTTKFSPLEIQNERNKSSVWKVFNCPATENPKKTLMQHVTGNEPIKYQNNTPNTPSSGCITSIRKSVIVSAPSETATDCINDCSASSSLDLRRSGPSFSTESLPSADNSSLRPFISDQTSKEGENTTAQEDQSIIEALFSDFTSKNSDLDDIIALIDPTLLDSRVVPKTEPLPANGESTIYNYSTPASDKCDMSCQMKTEKPADSDTIGDKSYNEEKASTSSSCQNAPNKVVEDEDCVIVSVFTPKEKRHRQIASTSTSKKVLSPRKKSVFHVPTSKWSDSKNRGKFSTKERGERVNGDKKLKKYMASKRLQRERIQAAPLETQNSEMPGPSNSLCYHGISYLYKPPFQWKNNNSSSKNKANSTQMPPGPSYSIYPLPVIQAQDAYMNAPHHYEYPVTVFKSNTDVLKPTTLSSSNSSSRTHPTNHYRIHGTTLLRTDMKTTKHE